MTVGMKQQRFGASEDALFRGDHPVGESPSGQEGMLGRLAGALNLKDTDWMSDAACARHPDPDIFFPEPGRKGQSSTEAKAICATCPVRELCDQFAGEKGEAFGVWGGKGQRARRRQSGRQTSTKFRCRADGCERVLTSKLGSGVRDEYGSGHDKHGTVGFCMNHDPDPARRKARLRRAAAAKRRRERIAA